jgi:hypothetical protein
MSPGRSKSLRPFSGDLDVNRRDMTPVHTHTIGSKTLLWHLPRITQGYRVWGHMCTRTGVRRFLRSACSSLLHAYITTNPYPQQLQGWITSDCLARQLLATLNLPWYWMQLCAAFKVTCPHEATLWKRLVWTVAELKKHHTSLRLCNINKNRSSSIRGGGERRSGVQIYGLVCIHDALMCSFAWVLPTHS